jgi:hypothetical protein
MEVTGNESWEGFWRKSPVTYSTLIIPSHHIVDCVIVGKAKLDFWRYQKYSGSKGGNEDMLQPFDMH